jgi:hypothetical protein
MSANIPSAALDTEEFVDTLLQLIAELDFYDRRAFHNFDNCPLAVRRVIATALVSKLPGDKQFAVMDRFAEIERLTAQIERLTARFKEAEE